MACAILIVGICCAITLDLICEDDNICNTTFCTRILLTNDNNKHLWTTEYDFDLRKNLLSLMCVWYKIVSPRYLLHIFKSILNYRLYFCQKWMNWKKIIDEKRVDNFTFLLKKNIVKWISLNYKFPSYVFMRTLRHCCVYIISLLVVYDACEGLEVEMIEIIKRKLISKMILGVSCARVLLLYQTAKDYIRDNITRVWCNRQIWRLTARTIVFPLVVFMIYIVTTLCEVVTCVITLLASNRCKLLKH